MAQATLICGLTADMEHLNAIGLWASEAVDTRTDRLPPPAGKWGFTLLGMAAEREQSRDFKLEMLQAGASHMLTLMEDWLREAGDDMDEDLRESLSAWTSTLDNMAQEFEDAKEDEE